MRPLFSIFTPSRPVANLQQEKLLWVVPQTDRSCRWNALIQRKHSKMSPARRPSLAQKTLTKLVSSTPALAVRIKGRKIVLKKKLTGFHLSKMTMSTTNLKLWNKVKSSYPTSSLAPFHFSGSKRKLWWKWMWSFLFSLIFPHYSHFLWGNNPSTLFHNWPYSIPRYLVSSLNHWNSAMGTAEASQLRMPFWPTETPVFLALDI